MKSNKKREYLEHLTENGRDYSLVIELISNILQYGFLSCVLSLTILINERVMNSSGNF